MTYTLDFYSESVQSEIFDWPDGIQASFTSIAEQMQEYGPNLGMPYTRAMKEGLFEIPTKGREGIGRGFFCTLVGKRIVILHGFIKKTEQTPARELRTARQQLTEEQNG